MSRSRRHSNGAAEEDGAGPRRGGTREGHQGEKKAALPGRLGKGGVAACFIQSAAGATHMAHWRLGLGSSEPGGSGTVGGEGPTPFIGGEGLLDAATYTVSDEPWAFKNVTGVATLHESGESRSTARAGVIPA